MWLRSVNVQSSPFSSSVSKSTKICFRTANIPKSAKGEHISKGKNDLPEAWGTSEKAIPYRYFKREK